MHILFEMNNVEIISYIMMTVMTFELQITEYLQDFLVGNEFHLLGSVFVMNQKVIFGFGVNMRILYQTLFL